MFTKNIGSTDKILRIIIGIVLVSLFFILSQSLLVSVGAMVGVVLIVTSFINFCPIYGLFGMKTNK